MSLVVLVCGDRNWNDLAVIQYVLNYYRKDMAAVIHGNCDGADKIAGRVAEDLGIPVRKFPYLGHLGRAGGPVRNKQMLDEGRPNVVIAFHNNLAISTGTKNMLGQAKKAGVRCLLCSNGQMAVY